jgi:hypothetical protein
MNIKMRDAIASLAPDAEWILRGDTLEWLDGSQAEPTQAEIDAEVIRLQAEYDSQAYARLRKAEYPSIEECVHSILDDDLVALQAKRADVKARFPK